MQAYRATSTRAARAAGGWRAAPWRRDMVTGLIGVWLVTAVAGDGWAHLNVPTLETFFTPWHAALYSAFAVMAAWIGLLAWFGRARGRPVVEWLPYGYAGTALGLVVFGIGGAADLVWHETFGIEVAVDALVSPTHLLLGVGGLLILTSGLRAQRVLSRTASDASPTTWPLPAILSLVLSTALISFFLLYVSAFPMPAPVEPFVPTPENTPGHMAAELPVIAALGAYLVSTAMFTVPFLIMLRSRAGLPRGGITLLVGTIAALSVAVLDFPPTAVAGALGATLGAVAADIGLVNLGRLGYRSSLPPVLAAAVAALVWSGQLAGLAIADALRWPVSLWLGVVVLTAFAAAALGLLAAASTK
jgi:hypothetical protein